MAKELIAGSLLKGGKYRIEKVLGQGSFGITYLASMTSADGDAPVYVAVKEFFMNEINHRNISVVSAGDKFATFAHYRDKFKREALLLSRFNHPNIVRVIEAFEENNTAYYVMEYIDGGDLNYYLARHGGRLPEEEVIEIAGQISEALQYMHAAHMLHLDLKPGNIMRSTDGTVKLIDFGLSKQYLDNGEPETSTKVGHGTPGYAAPEQVGFRKDSSFAATMDVYSMGATLFKLLTGKTPPEAYAVLECGFPRQMLRDVGVSQEMIDLIEHAMSPKRLNRPQTIEALMEAMPGGDAIVATVNDDNNELEDDPALCFACDESGNLQPIAVEPSSPEWSDVTPKRSFRWLLRYSGRLSRRPFAKILGIFAAWWVVAFVLAYIVGQIMDGAYIYGASVYAGSLFMFLALLPMFGACVRRSRSAVGDWWMALIPAVAFGFALFPSIRVAAGALAPRDLPATFVMPAVFALAGFAVLLALPDEKIHNRKKH